MRKLKFKRMLSLTSACVLLCCLSGCMGGGEDVGDDEIVVYHEEPAPEYTMDVVRRGDVESSLSINATYVQITQQDVAFQSEQLRVDEVFVKVGDEVKAGQILAQCNLTDVLKQIDSLKEDVEYQNLLLKQMQEKLDLDIKIREDQIYMTAMYDSDYEKMEEDIEAIKLSYKTSIEDLEDKIYLDNLKLNECNKKVADGTLYAPISGNISFIKTDLEGSITSEGEKVMTIVDNSVCAFRVDKPTYKDLFYEGQVLQLRVGLGVKMQIYEATPFMMDSWDPYLYFKLLDDQVNIKTGTLGSVYVDLESVHDVLYLANKYIRTVDDRSYVYVMDENGYRSVKYIETGLKGLEFTEIVSGLNEGDFVILK